MNWFCKVENIANALQCIGIVVDFVAFWGLYKIKIKPIPIISKSKALDNARQKEIATIFQFGKIDRHWNILNEMIDETNRNLKDFENSITNNDDKARFWLIWAIFGFALQFIGQLLSSLDL